MNLVLACLASILCHATIYSGYVFIPLWFSLSDFHVGIKQICYRLFENSLFLTLKKHVQ